MIDFSIHPGFHPWRVDMGLVSHCFGLGWMRF